MIIKHTKAGAANKNIKTAITKGSVKIGTPQLARMVRRAAWIKLVKIQHRTKKNKKS